MGASDFLGRARLAMGSKVPPWKGRGWIPVTWKLLSGRSGRDAARVKRRKQVRWGLAAALFSPPDYSFAFPLSLPGCCPGEVSLAGWPWIWICLLTGKVTCLIYWVLVARLISGLREEDLRSPGSGLWSLGRADPLEEGMATYCGIFVWRIPWTEEPGGLQCYRVGCDWAWHGMNLVCSGYWDAMLLGTRCSALFDRKVGNLIKRQEGGLRVYVCMYISHCLISSKKSESRSNFFRMRSPPSHPYPMTPHCLQDTISAPKHGLQSVHTPQPHAFFCLRRCYFKKFCLFT